MRYGSVCSGIEAATVAWHRFGWTPSWFSEIASFPSAVLAHHYPNVVNLGDMTRIPALVANQEIEAPDILCGGTPCQAFSIAGLRQSLNDDRGNLSLIFCEVANAIDTIRQSRGEKPAIILWENVPGVLSTSDNAFGCFLAGIVGESDPLVPPRKRWENAGVVVGPQRTAFWRVLDAQYFGLAQRRKRIFVVASSRNDIDIGQILFEFDSVQRHSPPSRKTGETNSSTAQTSLAGNVQGLGFQDVSPTLRANAKQSLMSGDGQINSPFNRTGAPNQELDAYVVVSNHDVNETIVSSMHKGGGRADGVEIPLAIAFKVRGEGTYTGEKNGDLSKLGQHGGSGMISYEEKTFTISTSQDQFVAYTMREDATNNTFSINETDVALTLQATQPTSHRLSICSRCCAYSYCIRSAMINSHHAQMLVQEVVGHTQPLHMRVRRLTPMECERLQGFPDLYTLIPYRGKPAEQCPDGLRYHALGNSWAVNVIVWIGNRINRVVNGEL
jgi:DNA (cytosine-5)-methyltransferase 1